MPCLSDDECIVAISGSMSRLLKHMDVEAQVRYTYASNNRGYKVAVVGPGSYGICHAVVSFTDDRLPIFYKGKPNGDPFLCTADAYEELEKTYPQV
tara:strand:- start:188 stop:475 length:288 start_codon:yes stop_codon:yes gene_type:complete